MEKKALLLCFVVGFLGLLSAATGFGAEATRIKVLYLPLALVPFVTCALSSFVFLIVALHNLFSGF